MAKDSNETSAKEFDKEFAKRAPSIEDAAYDKAETTELSRSELVNKVVDQTTGEVKQGQPGGTDGSSATDRPTLSEEDAREINGYAGFSSIGEQIAAVQTDEDTSDKLVRKA